MNALSLPVCHSAPQSNSYSFNAKVAELIKHQRECYNWEFLFLGADLESVEYAKTLNVEPQYSQQFDELNDNA